MVDVEFSRPLSPETASKLKGLARSGINILKVPPPLAAGFWFTLTDCWDARIIAQYCFNILQAEGFEIKRILCKNFVPDIDVKHRNLKTTAIETSFREEISKQYYLIEEGDCRYRIFTPFQFRNGDHLGIILKKNDGDWFLTDEGHTCQHLSCRLSLIQLEIIMDNPFLVQALAELGIEDRQRELLIKIVDTEYAYALYRLLHVLLQVITLAELVASN